MFYRQVLTVIEQVKSSIDQLDWDDFLNRGLQYGDGLFETMRMVNGRVPLWQWHWQRLSDGAHRFGLELPEESCIKNHVSSLSHVAGDLMVKLLLFRKAKSRGYGTTHEASDWVLTAHMLPKKTAQTLTLGLAQLQLGVQPVLAGIKHLNRLEQVFLANELAQTTCDELVVCSQAGEVVEAVSQNILWSKGHQLYTPCVDSCGVAGVGLAWLNQYFDIQKIKIKPSEMERFEGMYLINSVRGVSVVESVQGVKKFSTSSPLHDKIKHLWSELIKL